MGRAALILQVALAWATPVARAQAPTEPPESVSTRLHAEPGGLTADAAARMAIDESPGVERADSVREQSAATVGRIRATVIPRLDLTAGYSRLSEVPQPPFEFGGMSIDNPFPQILNRYDAQVSLTVGVTDIFLARLPAYRGALAGVDAARYRAEAVRANVALQAREAFYQYVHARAAQLVAQDSVRVLTAHCDDLQALLDAGVVTRSDLLSAQAQLAGAQVLQARTGGAVDVTERRLRQLTGLASDNPPGIGEDLEDALPPPPGAEDVVARALADRPEVHALQAVIEARGAELRIQRAAQLPRLDVVASAGTSRPNPRIIPQADRFDRSWEVGVRVSWSPNDFFAAHHGTRESEEVLAQARADLRELEQGIEIAAASAATDYRTALASIEAGQQELDAAVEGYRSRRELFLAGAATSSDVLDAEVQLRRAQLDHLSAQVDARIAQARLQHAIGQATPEGGTP